MDTLITIQGFFYTKIPFTLANAEAVRKGSIRGTILSQGGNEATILRTKLRSPLSIALVVRTKNEDFVTKYEDFVTKNEDFVTIYEDFVLAINEKGFDANGIQYFIYEKTDYPTYNPFTPDPYQACLIRLRGDNEVCWEVAVCDGYNKDNYPTFFYHDHEYVYDLLPLDDCTETIIGKTITWEKFVEKQINNTESLF